MTLSKDTCLANDASTVMAQLDIKSAVLSGTLHASAVSVGTLVRQDDVHSLGTHVYLAAWLVCGVPLTLISANS